jgi:3-phosphoshikimate 1-carboxyvinyltransferase
MALPDLIEIVPLTAPVRAEITVPGSKSITNRALILAALADGETILRGALWSEDTQIMVECLQHLGFMVNVEADPAETCNRTITVYGNGGAVPRGGTEAQPLDLFVGNAGTAARFLAPFLCLGSGVYRLHGVPRMHERPQAALFSALRELGYRVESENGNDKLPVRISHRGTEITEKKSSSVSSVPLWQKKKCRVSIEESSQFASALLLSAKQGGWEIEIVGENAEESPYVAMTMKLIEAFPNGGEFQIEPDASSGSYFASSSWLLSKFNLIEAIKKGRGESLESKLSYVKVKLWPNTLWQIDEAFVRLTKIEFPSGHSPLDVFALENYVAAPARVSRNTDLGDSIMTQIVLTPLLKSGKEPVQFTELGRLRVQECERVLALRTELTKCGAKVVEEADTLTVYPSKPEELHGAEIETYNDHRMAMCFAVLGLKVPGIKIKNPACVKKTFPNFFQKLAAQPPHGLGATILDAKTGRKLTHEELFAD